MTMFPEDSRGDPGAWDTVTAYDLDTERPTEVVLRVVAETTGRDVFVGEPLYTAIDPDALDALIRTSDERGVSVSFFYLGCHVVADRECVRVRQIADAGQE